jgi:hypothetical protein
MPEEPDEIDELVDYELTLPQAHTPWKFTQVCDRCGNEWHGLPKGNCPGLVVK